MLLNINQLISEFYIAWYLHHERIDKTIYGYLKTGEKLRDYYDLLVDTLFYSIRDYLVLAAAGEVRHAVDRTDYKVKEVHEDIKRATSKKGKRGANKQYSSSRDIVYGEATKYDPVLLLKNCRRVFSADWNHRGYGGEAWANITDAALDMWDPQTKFPRTVTIDHVIDLEHNNGTVFNKPVIYKYQPGLKRILDAKFLGVDELILLGRDACSPVRLSSFIKGICRLMKMNVDEIETGTSPISYTPIVWGTEKTTVIDTYTGRAVEDESSTALFFAVYSCIYLAIAAVIMRAIMKNMHAKQD